MRIINTALRLLGATSGEQILKTAAAASGQITLPAGTTDFSATSGLVQQASAGAAFTVGNTAGSLTAGAAPAPSGGVLTGDVVAQRLIVNANTIANVPPFVGQIFIVQGADATANNPSIVGFGGNANLNIYRSQGTSTAQTAVVSGNSLGRFQAGGWDGSSWRSGAGSVQFNATDNWSGTLAGTSVVIVATPTGSTPATAVATFLSGVQVGTPTGGDKGAGTINVSAGVYANNVLLTSDARLKRDVEPLAAGCLELVEAIMPKSFRFIEPEPRPSDDEDMAPTPAGPPGWFDRTRWGFSAQDVEALIPEAVETDADGNKYLSPSDLTACLWRAVQELSARVAELEGREPAR